MAGCGGYFAQGFAATQICRPDMRSGQGPQKCLVWFGLAIPDNNLPLNAPPTHGAGQTHAHLYARNGKEYGVVNIDGSGSHGTKSNSRIQTDHAAELRKAGFNIPPDNLVEWVPLPSDVQLLLE